MPLYVKHAGVWKEATPTPKVSGVDTPAELWVKHAGVWKQVTSLVEVFINNPTPIHSGSTKGVVFPQWFSLNVLGGTSSSQTWGFTNQVGGSWGINQGQGGLSVKIIVNANSVNTPTTAVLYCDAVVNGVTYRATTNVTYTWLNYN